MSCERTFTRLIQGKNLKAKESEALFLRFFKGELPPGQAKAILLLLSKKGETAEELLGCVSALQALEKPLKHGLRNLIDTCGTGGDGSHSLNVSTLAAFVIAGAGGRVAKHGNRSITSKCGSSDLLKAFGVRLEAKPRRMIDSIKRNGIGYFHAPLYHPVFARVQPLRQALKVRTIFNLMGPLVNPLGVQRQIVGVAKKDYLQLYARVLAQKGMEKALVCHSRDGMDEISTAAPSDLAWVTSSRIRYETIHPQKFGFKKPQPGALKGGSPKKNAADSKALLQGKLKGPKRDIILLNAAAGLVVANRAKTLKQGIDLAMDSIDSGRAYQTLANFKKHTQQK